MLLLIFESVLSPDALLTKMYNWCRNLPLFSSPPTHPDSSAFSLSSLKPSLQSFISYTSPSIHFHRRTWPWMSHNSIFTACSSKTSDLFIWEQHQRLCCKSPHLSINPIRIILSWPSGAAGRSEIMHQSQQMFKLHFHSFLRFAVSLFQRWNIGHLYNKYKSIWIISEIKLRTLKIRLFRFRLRHCSLWTCWHFSLVMWLGNKWCHVLLVFIGASANCKYKGFLQLRTNCWQQTFYCWLMNHLYKQGSWLSVFFIFSYLKPHSVLKCLKEDVDFISNWRPTLGKI